MTEEELTVLDARLKPFQRRTWVPEVVNGDGPAAASKFSGVPALRAGESWPACANCGKAMQLFLQLNARDVPSDVAAAFDDGLLQFFYCTNGDPHCESVCEAFFPRARSSLLRMVPLTDAVDRGDPEIARGMFPASRIVSWTAAVDLPNWEELETLGAPLSDEEAEAMDESGFPRAGEKLRGWPLWVQGLEYPSCPQCGERMELLFQLDSEQNLPFMFGDAGVGHITQCPRHHAELAFGWACS